MIPTPEPRVNSPPRSKFQIPKTKSEQIIITLTFIVCMKLGMMCTDDTRVASSNGTCYHQLRVWERYGGKQGREM